MGTSESLIAVDVGNSRVKLGCFATPQSPEHVLATAGGLPLPLPIAALELDAQSLDHAKLIQWLASLPPPRAWWIGSVNRPAAAALSACIPGIDHAHVLHCGDLPLVVRLDHPERVGIDRLLSAVAANRLRESWRPAIVVSAGTAITVDLLAADGAFLGGAILPGIAMSAAALHEHTDLLPLIPMSELSTPPPPLGTATEAAMRSGLFWGAVGAIRELAARLAQVAESGSAQPDVFLTGGAAPCVAPLIGPRTLHVEHLTLAGIAIVARRDVD